MAVSVKIRMNKPDADQQEARRIRNLKKAARQEMQQYDSLLADLTTNWAVLTNAQQKEVQRLATVLVLKCCKYFWVKFNKGD